MDRRASREPEKRPVDPDALVLYLKLPFLGEQSYLTEKKINKCVRDCYKTVITRMVWCSKPNFTAATKDHIQSFDKSLVVYHFKCHCDNDYVGQTSRSMMERVREHVPVCVQKYIMNPQGNYKDHVKLVRASRKTAIAEHLLENRDCGLQYNDSMFSIIKQCANNYELKVQEAVLISTMGPTLCTQTKFDYVLSLV